MVAEKKLKRKAVDDDDGDDLDDAPAPPGCAAPQEPHEHGEYVRRLQKILDAIEIQEIDRDARLYLQRILRRYDFLRKIDEKRFPTKGEEEVTFLLRTVFESNNGASALTLPILRAVSGCMRQEWTGKGLKFIEAFDHVDLVGLHSTLCDLGLEDQLDRAIQRKLWKIFGPDELPKAEPVKVKPRPKMARPAGISERSWNDVLALRKKPQAGVRARASARMLLKRPSPFAYNH
jgi:hypothetical protein